MQYITKSFEHLRSYSYFTLCSAIIISEARVENQLNWYNQPNQTKLTWTDQILNT